MNQHFVFVKLKDLEFLRGCLSKASKRVHEDGSEEIVWVLPEQYVAGLDALEAAIKSRDAEAAAAAAK